MPTQLNITVFGPGGTTYIFRRTRELPGPGGKRPPRILASTPLDRCCQESGYVRRKGKTIWGHAQFDIFKRRWEFVALPAPSTIATGPFCRPE